MKSYLKLYYFTKGSRLLLIFGVIGGALEKCLAAFLAAHLFRTAIDLAPKDMRVAGVVIMKSILILAVIIFLYIISRLAREKACIESAGRLRRIIIERAMGATLGSFRKIESARILSALSSDSGMAFENLASSLVVPVTVVFLGMSGVVYIASMNYILGSCVLFIAVLQAVYSFILAIHMRKNGKLLLNARSNTHANLQEVMEGIITVRMDDLNSSCKEEYKKLCAEEQERAVRYGSLSGVVGGINNAAAQINEKFLLSLSGLLAIKDLLTAGQMVEVAGLASNVAGICNVSRILTDTQMATAGALRIFKLIDDLEKEPEGTEIAGEGLPKIQAQNLTFSYPGQKELINNASFSLESGKIVLLMGPSGSGKTTFLRLIQAMELPQSGDLLICGIKTSCWNRNMLRARIAYVPQEPIFFYGTILENLLDFGQHDLDRVIWAAKMANIHERICKLNGKYDTYLNDARNVFSGGELQRLAMARSLCRQADIFILDEPTSALDYENEMLLYEAMKNFKDKRIIILCTHKLSATKIADEILSMDKGQIIQYSR